MKKFETLAYSNPTEFIYGSAVHPVECKNGMVIGGGQVYPEINFTLPPISIDDTTFAAAREHYRHMITGVLTRAHELHAPDPQRHPRVHPAAPDALRQAV